MLGVYFGSVFEKELDVADSYKEYSDALCAFIKKLNDEIPSDNNCHLTLGRPLVKADTIPGEWFAYLTPSLLPKKYIWVKELTLDSLTLAMHGLGLTLDTLDLVAFSKLDTLRSITLGSSVKLENEHIKFPNGQAWLKIKDKIIIESESLCKEDIRNYVSSCKRFRWNTLVVGDTAGDERQATITGDRSFVDSIRGHRLQRWVVEAGSDIRGRRVTVLAKSDSFDAVLYVEFGEDSVLYSDDDGPGTNSFLEFQMPASGRVDILAGSYGADAEGKYSVRVGRPANLLMDEQSKPLGPLVVGDTAQQATITGDSGFIDPIRGHWLQRWVVEADSDIQGSRVTVLAESGSFDAVLYVVLGDSVLYSDDDGPGANSLLEFQMPASGRVDVLAGSYLPDVEGGYRLRVGAGGRARLLLDAAGGSSERMLGLTGGVGSDTARISGDAGFVDPIRGHWLQRWVVEADSDIQGSRVTVLAESGSFDAVLYVVLGDSVLYSDDDGPGANSLLEFQMPASGRVDVLAGSYSTDVEGGYRLRVAPVGSG